jgi:hypothetical protein
MAAGTVDVRSTLLEAIQNPITVSVDVSNAAPTESRNDFQRIQRAQVPAIRNIVEVAVDVAHIAAADPYGGLLVIGGARV